MGNVHPISLLLPDFTREPKSVFDISIARQGHAAIIPNSKRLYKVPCLIFHGTVDTVEGRLYT
jgi:hypothetical protein